MKRTLISLLCLSILFLGAMAGHYRQKGRRPFSARVDVNVEKLQEKLQAPLPEWALSQIEEDLSCYQKEGISKEMLDALFARREELRLVRFVIQDQKLTVTAPASLLREKQFRHLFAVMEKLVSLVPLPNLDCIVSLHDGFGGNVVEAPLFVFAKSQKANRLLLMPDFKALTGYPSLRRSIEEANRKYSWKSKQERAFWRGSATGGYATQENYRKLPRIALALFSKEHPMLLDAAITHIVQCDPCVPSLLAQEGVLGKRVTQERHLAYKYLVDVDGNSCSFERYFWLLLSNSLVLKQETSHRQWYYKGLRPYEHFLPLREDLSDLEEKIEWAKSHDAQAEKIASNGTRFIQEELSLEDTWSYLVHLLRAYAKLEQT